jgi:hypothetical protein
MNYLEMFLITAGLCLFEVISSIDNAIINGEVLATVSERARRWFLLWGILIAVFLIRGLLPFLILWMSNPDLPAAKLFGMLFSTDPAVMEAVEKSAPVLLVGGGTFLVFLFFHWWFLEPKTYGLVGEALIERHGVWFYAVVSILLALMVWYSIKINPMMAFSAVIGSTAFFITRGFRENAEKMEQRMLRGDTGLSDVSKILYLEVIDATFSIDGVLGAFAFTFSVPLILIGNGIGAVIVRQLTIKNIENVKKYVYLKNGAMYSILGLGSIMILESFHIHIPVWVTPVLTFSIVGYFFWKSVRHAKRQRASDPTEIKHKTSRDDVVPAPLGDEATRSRP